MLAVAVDQQKVQLLIRHTLQRCGDALLVLPRRNGRLDSGRCELGQRNVHQFDGLHRDAGSA
jgi:hypothetical protein